MRLHVHQCCATEAVCARTVRVDEGSFIAGSTDCYVTKVMSAVSAAPDSPRRLLATDPLRAFEWGAGPAVVLLFPLVAAALLGIAWP